MKAADFIDHVLRKKKRIGFNDTQIQMLLCLARTGRAMTTNELVSELRVSRFMVDYSWKRFQEGEVEQNGAGKGRGNDNLYELTAAGVVKLQEILKFEEKTG